MDGFMTPLVKLRAKTWLLVLASAIIPAIWAFVAIWRNLDSSSFDMMGVKASYPIAESLVILAVVTLTSFFGIHIPHNLPQSSRFPAIVKLLEWAGAVVAAATIWVTAGFMDVLWTGAFREGPTIGLPVTTPLPTWLLVILVLATAAIFRVVLRTDRRKPIDI